MGEFPDLVALGDWCRRVGLDLIQILPVNDTGLDPSPYNAQSAFALNPIFIRLEDVPGAESHREEIGAARARWESVSSLQYAAVRTFKLETLRRIFEDRFAAIARDESLDRWSRGNPWLSAYAESPGLEDKLFTAWVQFELDRQLSGAARALDKMGIALKGDIPILLSEDSVDVRSNVRLFNKGLRVGAPPDMFSEEGQNWRFPSFRWDEMERDGFAWWRSRLKWASRFYHAFRIDHVLGFFRIWCIPEGEASAAYGHFEPAREISREILRDKAGLTDSQIEELVRGRALVRGASAFAPVWHWWKSPALAGLTEREASGLAALIENYWSGQEDLWRDHGRKLLTAIAQSTDMLVCAEDLGVVPQCVPEVLNRLDILGLRVDRWSGWNGPAQTLKDLPRLTVCTTSTHDTSTLRGWWQEGGWDRQQYFHELGLPQPCPDYLTTEVCAAILERNLDANSNIVILPLQDILALHYDLRTLEPEAERINVPGKELPENWTYRMKMSVEDSSLTTSSTVGFGS